jgi:hypothetical protein
MNSGADEVEPKTFGGSDDDRDKVHAESAQRAPDFRGRFRTGAAFVGEFGFLPAAAVP